MPVSKDLRQNFLRPPQGGNGAGVPTHNQMTAVPLPPKNGLSEASGAGTSVKDRRLEAEQRGETPDEALARWRAESAARQAREAIGSGPGAQTSLRESFEAGEACARNSQLGSARQGQIEFRNYDRTLPVQTREDDPYGPDHYDVESAHTGTATPGSQVEGEALGANPKPERYPPVASTNRYRSDGKPNNTMQGSGER